MHSPTPHRRYVSEPPRAEDSPNRDDSSQFSGTPADEIDLFSIAAESVASMAETVVTGIRTTFSHRKIIFFGQVLALLMGLRGGTTAYLYLECNVMAPAFQLWWVYLILSTNLISHVYCASSGIVTPATSNAVFDLSILQQSKPKFSSPVYKLPFTSMTLNTPWWKYLILSILDLEGNYFTYLALKYTSLKSASLLDTVNIPAAMLASYLFLRKRYNCAHLVGASICLGGAMIMVLADFSEEQSLQGSDGAVLSTDLMHSRAVRGDVMAAMGGLFWGLKDTMSEGVLQVSSPSEFLGMLGMCGLFLTTFQTAVVEGPIVKDFFNGFTDSSYNTCSASETYGVFFAIILVFVLYYLGISRFLLVSEAALLQLSLLAADLYSLLFSIVEEHRLPTWMFATSMITILFGVLIYESVPEPLTTDVRLFGAYKSSPERDRQRQLESKGSSEELPYDTKLYEEQEHGMPGLELANRSPKRTGAGQANGNGKVDASSFEII